MRNCQDETQDGEDPTRWRRCLDRGGCRSRSRLRWRLHGRCSGSCLGICSICIGVVRSVSIRVITIVRFVACGVVPCSMQSTQHEDPQTLTVIVEAFPLTKEHTVTMTCIDIPGALTSGQKTTAMVKSRRLRLPGVMYGTVSTQWGHCEPSDGAHDDSFVLSQLRSVFLRHTTPRLKVQHSPYTARSTTR